MFEVSPDFDLSYTPVDKMCPQTDGRTFECLVKVLQMVSVLVPAIKCVFIA